MAHRFILLFLLGAATLSLGDVQVQSLGGKRDKHDDDDDEAPAEHCPPPPCPPPPPPPPSPPPPCPPPPPPQCKVKKCDDCKRPKKKRVPRKKKKLPKKKAFPKDDDKDDDKDFKKDDDKDFKNDNGKDFKNDDKDFKDDEEDDDDDKLSENDVRNLNNLLAVQFVLNDVLLRATLDGPQQQEQQQLSSSRKGAVLQSSGGLPIGLPDIPLIPDMLTEFSAISVAQINSILSVLRDQAIPRPENLNVSDQTMSLAVNRAFNGSLQPGYSIDNDPTKLLLAVQTLGPALAASVATGILPDLESTTATSLVAGILPALASQDASMRTVLYSQREARVQPYNYTVGEFMQRTSSMTTNLRAEGEEGGGGDDGGDDDGFLSRTTAGDILSVNVLGAGAAVPAQNVLDLLAIILNMADINV